MISPTLEGARGRAPERTLTVPLDAHWHQIGLLAVVVLSAVLNLVGLSREGYDNQYYAAAVKSMSESWHAFFFNSFDPAGFVSIDKPPLGFWFQVASVKLFGFNGVALLVPQALAGVLSVVLLYLLLARSFGRAAGLIAALALAVTPISVVTARNNTIDSTLVLFLLLGAWAVLRAAATGKLRWLLLSAVCVGLGFNIKMLQAYLVVPAFGLIYLLGTRTSLWRRVGHLVLAGIVLLAVSLSWIMAVDLTPPSQRPWVDSTTTNSALDLAVGYNGLQRLTGNRAVSGGGAQRGSLPGAPTVFGGTRGASAAITGGPGGRAFDPGGNGGPGGVGENGPTGPLRLLDTQLGSQIGWLLALAVLGFVLAVWQTRPRLRILDDRQRSLVLWGMWLLTTGLFFSVALFYHTYYLVTLAPAMSALAGIAVVALWKEYRRPGSRLWWLLLVGLMITAGVQTNILASYPSWARWLTPLVVIGCVVAALSLAVFRVRPRGNVRIAGAATALAVLVLMAPATVFAAYTMQHTQTGAILRAGPTPSGSAADRNGFGGPPNGAFGGRGAGLGTPPGAPGASGPPRGGAPGRVFGRPGAFGRDRAVSPALLTYLVKHRGKAKFLLATASSQEAAPIIIATGQPVMSLGGFTGSDPILTPSKLAAMARQGVVRYFLLGGGGPGGRGGSSGLMTWIQQHSTLVSVGGMPLYKYTG